MRFVKHEKQWALQFTYAWEVDMLSKLPECDWVPLTYVDEQQPIGAIHVGTLKVCFLDGQRVQPERTFVMSCVMPHIRKFFKFAEANRLSVGELL